MTREQEEADRFDVEIEALRKAHPERFVGRHRIEFGIPSVGAKPVGRVVTETIEDSMKVGDPAA